MEKKCGNRGKRDYRASRKWIKSSFSLKEDKRIFGYIILNHHYRVTLVVTQLKWPSQYRTAVTDNIHIMYINFTNRSSIFILFSSSLDRNPCTPLSMFGCRKWSYSIILSVLLISTDFFCKSNVTFHCVTMRAFRRGIRPSSHSLFHRSLKRGGRKNSENDEKDPRLDRETLFITRNITW